MRPLRGRSYLGAGMLVVLAYASGCSAFRAVTKDPAAAVTQAKADAAKAERTVQAACTELAKLEGAGLVPAGPARSDADAFCAAVAAARGE